MEGAGIASHRAHILRMQEGIRRWVRRHGASQSSGGATGQHTGDDGGTRRRPPLVLLAALAASACCPLFTTGDGVLTLAGSGVISAMGTGVLSGLLASAVDRVWKRSEKRESPPSPAELEDAIAGQIRAGPGRRG